MDQEIKLSVIIPTRNRAEYLKLTLSSLLKQSFSAQHYELIIVDNGSTDHTKAVCNAYENEFVNFCYVYEPKPGLHHGRHAGMKASKAEYLVFADDDIEPFSTWLISIYSIFSIHPQVVLVGGKNLPMWEEDPPQWLSEKWITPQAEGKWLGALSILDFGEEEKYISPYFVWGCNFSIRKDVLLQAKGFHPDGMPKELIHLRGDGETYVSRFVLENGYKAYYHPDASVYHRVPKSRMTIDYFKSRAFNQGISDAYTAIRIEGKVLENRAPSIWQKFKKGIKNFLFHHDIRELLSRDELEHQIRSSHQNGYLFLQNMARNNSSLLDWILKEHYLD